MKKLNKGNYDDVSLYEILFDLQISICETFPSLSPFDIRKQRFSTVMLLVRRLNNRSNKRESKTHIKEVNGKKDVMYQ